MKNPNSPFNKIKQHLLVRWSSEDYPGGDLRFRPENLAKDVLVYLGLPLFAVLLYKGCDSGDLTKKRAKSSQARTSDANLNGDSKSQILDFAPTVGRIAGSRVAFARKSPGTLVKVRLLNVVETYSTAPVHVQIVDRGLGATLVGGTLIGDATPDSAFERININFRYARDPNREFLAAQISARALGLDGTLGLQAKKKEGFFARSVARSAQGTSQNVGSQSGESDFKQILFRALTAGLVQEFGNTTQVESNRSQVLTLTPPQEFYVELTDFFPGGN